MACDEDDLRIVPICCTLTTTLTHLSSNSSSLIPTHTSTSNNNYASISSNHKHSHPNRTSSTTSIDSTEEPQHNDNASNWKKKRRRGRRKLEKQSPNFNHHSNTLFARFNWRPFGLLLFILFLFISPLSINALPQQSLDHLPRLQRSIVSEPINIKDNVELQQKVTTQNPILDSLTSIVQQVTEKTTQKSTTKTTTVPTTITTSKASTPAPTPFTTKDVLLDPDSIILFNRSVYYNDEEYQNPERKTEIFNINSSMNGTLTFQCDATVRNPRLLLTNLTFDTYWVDTHTMAIVSNNSVLKLENVWTHVVGKTSQQYKCAARLTIPSRNINGIIHSRSIVLKPVNAPVLTLTPLSVDVAHMQSVRLKCEYNTSIDQIEEFYWSLNGSRIFVENEEYKIYNVNTYSLLYVFNMHTVFRNGFYSCHVLLTNGELLNSSHEIDVRILDDPKLLNTSQIEVVPPEIFDSRMGDTIALECWKPDVKETRWYRKHSQMKELISTDPVLFFKNATQRLNGDYECQLENHFGSVRFYKIEVYVDYNFFRAEPVDFTITRKHQGTPAKLLCHTIPAYEELPRMANWFKDGRLLDSPEDRVYRRTSLIDDHHPMRIGRVAYFAMAQVEDQGFYECVVQKRESERSQKILLLVEQTTNLTITNLNITVDHVRSCFSSQFDIPKEIDFRLGPLSTFFLVYYVADMSKPLNIIPSTQGAKCTPNNRCSINCWTPPYPFDPATKYTFRMSAVFYDESKITPLSHEVNATSWDGPASKGVYFNWIYKPERSELELTWKKPQLVGTLQKYHLEVIQLETEFVSAEHRRKLFKVKVEGDKERHLITNISAPFSLQVRLIPVTRSGVPSAHSLQSAKDFGYTLISVSDDDLQLTDDTIPPPDVKIQQVNLEPKFDLHFDGPTVRDLNVTSIRVQYRPLMSLHLNSPLESKEMMEANGQEELSNDGKTTIVLKRGLKAGTLYQICTAYERSTQAILGFWHCENVPLFDEQGQLSPIKTEDTFSNDPKQLTPRPVNCQKSNCRCAQSKEDHNVVLIKWRSSDPLSYKASSATSYMIHYTLNETDPNAPKWATKVNKFYQDGNETVLELRGLFPSLPYQIMLEAQNEYDVGIEGTYFNCMSPKNLDLPPPIGPVKLNKLGENVAHIYWDPPLPLNIIETMPDFDGYVLRWRSGNGSEQNAFVEGHEINNVMISNLIPGLKYTAYLASHSKTKGDSPLMSQSFSFEIQPLKPLPTPAKPQEYDKVKELMEADEHKPFYQTLRFKAYSILALIAIFIIVCCAGLAALISMKYYDWFQSPQAKERRRKKKLKNAPSLGAISSGRASNASSRLSLNSIGSGSNQPVGQERESLIPNNTYGLPLHRESRHKRNPLDLKGGLQGYRPRLNKTEKALKDPSFKETALELNKDPTGMGKTLSEVLADMRKAQAEEIEMYEKRRFESKVKNDMELQTFSIRYGDFDSMGYGKKSLASTSSTTSRHSHHRQKHHSNKHRPKLQKQDHLVGTSYPISSMEDDGECSTKKESFQAEIHPRPYNRRALFAHRQNRPPMKTRSLDQLSVKKTNKRKSTAYCSSDSRLQDTEFVAEHSKPLPRHFCKRPSLISLQCTNGQIVPPSRPSSEIQTPSTPLCSTIDGQISDNGALEFHLGANGIERRRLKTTTATPTHHPIPRKKFSVGAQNGAVTASLPNLSDSGIVYDETGHATVNGVHHHTYFHHPSQNCPMSLHPIASMKVLKLGNEVVESEETKNLDAKVNDERNLIVHPTFNCQHLMTHDQIRRRTSIGGTDGESAVSTSSGASSRGSGASHRYEEYDDEEVDMAHESSQLISPQTPVRAFIPIQPSQIYGPGTQIFVPTSQTYNPLMTPQTCISPASLTPKDYCSIQICDYHEDKNPLGVVNEGNLNETIDSRWFHENI